MQILNDFDTSVRKALDEIDPNWESYKGLIVCGSHTEHGTSEGVISKIKEARENNEPFLGLCMGFQLALVEFARNVIGLVEANSTEINPDTTAPIIIRMDNLRVGMRPVGSRMESFWHYYAFNEEYLDLFINNGWNFIKSDIIAQGRLNGPNYFVGTQYHPEYQSTAEKPHPILKEFLEYAKLAM
jgi:CTP synthase